ncbi:hypothetical protein [Ferruginibacter sp. HRS2-29]|uniref:hypothetical protein n=1 Tax=Ferruginibacter sp. HRS2-29 TaxID=2487334 RepID=UPI0020CBF1CD|nr:hypothetical protein [Ferruginibacter sp. HRS2-29]MCP9749820.1 hypothetical protein [Ferruginibacter sp. HRS2-29]
MATTTLFHSATTTYTNKHIKTNIIARFFTWCTKQEGKRLMWMGIILPLQACILAPATLAIALLAGIHFSLFIPIIAALVLTFITNLAALPTKITIPVFALAVLVDIGVMIAALVIGADLTRIF